MRPMLLTGLLGLALLLPASAVLKAAPPVAQNESRPPSYDEARLLFEKHWKERFPVPYRALYDVPPGSRILSARSQGIPVFYYRFEVDLPRMFRGAGDQVETAEEPARRVEVWFRYQPQLRNADFAFVRIDLLPGTDRRWID